MRMLAVVLLSMLCAGAALARAGAARSTETAIRSRRPVRRSDATKAVKPPPAPGSGLVGSTV